MSNSPQSELSHEDSARRSWPRRMLNRMEVDRAVFFAIAQRGWQFIAGPITLVLIAKYFSNDQQGYYYTFWGVVALQMFFELALPQTIITTASHQWQLLKLTDSRRIEGDADAMARLNHLVSISVLVFSVTGALFVLSVSFFGLWFFSQETASEKLNWRAPWVTLMLLSGMTFLSTPLLSVLEGCNRVTDIYRLQLIRSVIGNVAVWVAIPLGCGLWVPAIATLVRLICELYMIAFKYGVFFVSMRRPLSDAKLDWRKEMWPFQSRVLLKGLTAYLNFDVMSPIIFNYHGAAAAGQLGMTVQILGALRAACSSWVRVRYAQMGILVASGDYRELDRVFFRVAKIGAWVLFVSGAAYVLFILILNFMQSHYASRLMAPGETVVLLMGLQASLLVEFIWTYIHSHRVSPHLVLSMLGSLLSGLLIWWWGAFFGNMGVTLAYFLMQAALYLPLSIWAWRHFCRQRAVSVAL